MRVHLLSVPHCPTTYASYLDGFAQATIRFAKVLKMLGHEVILYASEHTDAPCDELVMVIHDEEAATLLEATQPEPTPYQYAYIEPWSPIYQLANARTIKAIGRRKDNHDVICSIAGGAQDSVMKAHLDLPFIEYSIGYQGCVSPYRVYESHIWRHFIHGQQKLMDVRFFDAVIPLFFEADRFPFQAQKEPFVLYCGRLVERKGLQIACRAAAAAGLPLKVIGHGNRDLVTHGAEYLGALNEQERNHWLARAQCVITPTTYLEPFCSVVPEAAFCGTPAVTTDMGGFVETVEPGVTGYRCTYLGEFVEALYACAHLDPHVVRQRALARFSLEAVAPLYQQYFDRIALLWEKGWDTVTAPVLEMV